MPEIERPVTTPTDVDDAPAASVEDLIARETEYDNYTGALQKRIWLGVFVLGFVVMAVLLPSWLNGGETAVPLVFAYIRGDTALAAFGIVAAIVLALQIVTRTPPTQQPDREFEARKTVLTILATLLVVVSLGLGGYLAVQNLAVSTFGAFDPVRTFGPAGGGVILALLAADAASADSRPRGPKDRAAQDARYAMRLREQVVSLRAGIGREPNRAEWVKDIAMLVAVPLVVLVVLYVRTPIDDVANGVAAALLILGYCVAVYAVVYDTFVAATRGTWSFVEASFLMSIIVFLVLALSLFIAITETSTEENWLARSAGGLFGFLAVTSAAAALAWFLTRAGGEKNRRGLLRDIAVARVTAQLRAAEDRTARTISTTPWNKVAIASLAVSVLFPFGAILGTVARRQIVLAEQEESPQRGSRLAAVAIGISCCVPVLMMAGLVVVIIVNPAVV